MFQLKYAFKELVKRPIRSIFVLFIITTVLVALLVTSSLTEAMLRVRSQVLAPLSATKIDLVITSHSSNNFVESRKETFIDLKNRKLKPGQYFLEDTVNLNSLFSLDARALSQLSKDKRVVQIEPALLLKVNRIEGKTPEKIIISEKKVSPLTNQEKFEINRKVSQNPRFAALQKEFIALSDLVLNNRASSQQKKKINEIGQQMVDIEFSYYPERFKKFEEERLIPASLKVKQETLGVAGVGAENSKFGLLRESEIVSGRFFKDKDSSVVILREDFARNKSLKVGDNFVFKGLNYTIVGCAKPTAGLSTAQIYMPLSQLQQITNTEATNMFLLQVKGVGYIEDVKKLVKQLLPESQLMEVNQASLQILGSLGKANSLANAYSKIIMIIITSSALGVIMLTVITTLSGRRKELGALKALGWSKRRLASQVSTELMIQAMLGIILAICFSQGLISFLRYLHLQADITISTLDNKLTGLGLNSEKALLYLKPELDIIFTFKVAIFSVALLLFFGYFSAWLSLGNSTSKLLAHEGE